VSEACLPPSVFSDVIERVVVQIDDERPVMPPSFSAMLEEE